MKHKIEFGFGIEQDKHGNTIDVTRRLDALASIRKAALAIFGAYTIVRTEGGWIDPKTGRVYEEEGRTLFALVEDAEVWQKEITALAQCIKTALSQEAVFVSVTALDWRLQ